MYRGIWCAIDIEFMYVILLAVVDYQLAALHLYLQAHSTKLPSARVPMLSAAVNASCT